MAEILTEHEKAMHKEFKNMTDGKLQSEWRQAERQLELHRELLQSIDAERSYYTAKREHIVVARQFGRLEADAVLEDIQSRLDFVSIDFKFWARREHACRNEAMRRGMK
jgi:hypothetical protein